MVRRRSQGQAPEGAESGNGPQAEERLAEGSAMPHNGTSEPSAVHDGQEGAQPAAPPMQRAEEMVEQMANQLGHYASVIGHKILWLAARAREEAEDIWAEAQALRRGEPR